MFNHNLIQPLFAVGWEELAGVVFFVISGLLWVINHFAGPAAKPKGPPQRNPAGAARPPAGPPRANDPLQAEIDEFLRQAQARRDGKPAPPPQRAPVAQVPDRREQQPGRGNPPQQNRPPRKTVAGGPPKRGARREENRPGARPVSVPLSQQPSAPVAEQKRRSLSDETEEHMGRGKFAERAASLSRMREESDSEFQSHMQRVFDRDLSTLKPALGMFEKAGASAKAATQTALDADAVTAAGAQSATAPNIVRKQASDIALFLAGRKNIRDAIILNEILKRPEW